VLASGSSDNAIRLWDATSGALLRVLEGHQDPIGSLAALALDGRAVLASGSSDNAIRLWDAASGALLRVLEGHQKRVASLAALTLDGRAVLASGSRDNTIRLWHAASGALLRVLEGHQEQVVSLAPLTLDGRAMLASGSLDNTIRLWDAASGDCLTTISGGFGAWLITSPRDETSLLAQGPGRFALIDLARLAARDFSVAQGLKMRRFALSEDYSDSFVDMESDPATGGVRVSVLGANAWRDFIAIGQEVDGRQTVRPIDDMRAAPRSAS
jgi:WD40 repeat protein